MLTKGILQNKHFCELSFANVILKLSKKQKNEQLQKVIQIIFELFTIRYTVSYNKKRIHQLYHVIELLLLHQQVDFSIELLKERHLLSSLDQNVKNEGLSIKQEQQTPIPPKNALQAPPALPPKTKIMNSPSRHLFSPSSDITDSAVEGAAYSSSNDTATTVEYIPGYFTYM